MWWIYVVTALAAGVASVAQLKETGIFADKKVKIILLVAGVLWMVGSVAWLFMNRGGIYAVTNFFAFAIVVFIAPNFTGTGKKAMEARISTVSVNLESNGEAGDDEEAVSQIASDDKTKPDSQNG